MSAEAAGGKESSGGGRDIHCRLITSVVSAGGNFRRHWIQYWSSFQPTEQTLLSPHGPYFIPKSYVWRLLAQKPSL